MSPFLTKSHQPLGSLQRVLSFHSVPLKSYYFLPCKNQDPTLSSSRRKVPMKLYSTAAGCAVTLLLLLIPACRQEDSPGGLSKTDFEAIVEFSGGKFGKGFIGLKVEEENLSGTVVLPSGTRAPFSGQLSPDPDTRWLKIQWQAPADGCSRPANYHLEMTWANLSALTGTGRLAIRCEAETPIEIAVSATLLWDPRYAP